MSDNYGTDLWCFDQVYTGRLATGTDLLAQAAYRRLTTPRGTLDDGDEGAIYGLDLADFVGHVGDASAVASLPAVVSAELLKDDRFASVDVKSSAVTGTDGLTAITLGITITPHDADDPFTLTVGVSSLTVQLLGVSPQ